MTSWDIIAEIESDNGKLHKQGVIEREASANNNELFEGFMLAFHPLNTFGFKKVPFSTVAASNGQLANWDDFVELAENLQQRILTGHAARDAVTDFMLTAGQLQWDNWMRRILIQDMRAGFSESTVNKAVKQAKTLNYAIPVFKCALAKDSAGHASKLVGKKQIEIKLDGVRVLTIIKTNGKVLQTSRNGKEMKNFGHIKEEIAATLSFDVDMVLDGEVMSSSFQDLMTQVNRKSNVNAADAVLHVFDIIPLADFLKGKGTISQQDRSDILRNLDESYTMDTVRFLNYEIVDLDSEIGQVRYNKLNREALAGGYEGLLIKDPKAVYQCKRHTGWLKLKPFIEITLEVVAIEEGTGKHEGRLGALVCEGIDSLAQISISGKMENYWNEGEGDEVLIEVNVGSGFSDEQRDEFWTDSIIGQMVEIRADTVTKNRNGTYSVRFPRFMRFRDIDGEKV